MTLPYEILEEILGRLDFHDLAVLSTTNRTFQFITESILYQSITLGGAISWDIFANHLEGELQEAMAISSNVRRNFHRMRSITRSEPRGHHVRTLAIETTLWLENPSALLPSFFRQIEKAIMLMPNVKSLLVADIPGTLCPLISLCGSLTKVEEFYASIPADSLLASWLENNRDINAILLPSPTESMGEYGQGLFVRIAAVNDLSAATHTPNGNLHSVAFEALKLSTAPLEILHLTLFGDSSLGSLLRCQGVHLGVKFFGLTAHIDTIWEVRDALNVFKVSKILTVSNKLFRSLVQVLSRFPNLAAFYVAALHISHLEGSDFRSYLDMWRSHCPHLGRIIFRNITVVDGLVKKAGYLHDGDRGWVRDDSRLVIDEEFDIHAQVQEGAGASIISLIDGTPILNT
jgi:hypothetical protein